MFSTFTAISSVTTKAAGGVADVPDLVAGSIVTYKFNSADISGTSVKNKASGTSDMTLVGSATTSSQTGQEGSGCLLIPNAGYTQASFSKTVNISASNGLTISFWFKSIGMNTNHQFMRLFLGGGQFWTNLDNLGNGNINWYIYTGTNYTTGFQMPSATVFDGTWKHFCIVVQDTTTVKWYLNGTLKQTDSKATPVSTTFTGLQIADTTSSRTNGYFDGVRIYNSALTSTDVTTLYNSGVVN
jgi:hypothetical protein